MLGSLEQGRASTKDSTFLGIIVFYLGVVIMMGSWFEVVRTLRRHPATPVSAVVAIIVAWAVPVLVMQSDGCQDSDGAGSTGSVTPG